MTCQLPDLLFETGLAAAYQISDYVSGEPCFIW